MADVNDLGETAREEAVLKQLETDRLKAAGADPETPTTPTTSENDALRDDDNAPDAEATGDDAEAEVGEELSRNQRRRRARRAAREAADAERRAAADRAARAERALEEIKKRRAASSGDYVQDAVARAVDATETTRLERERDEATERVQALRQEETAAAAQAFQERVEASKEIVPDIESGIEKGINALKGMPGAEVIATAALRHEEGHTLLYKIGTDQSVFDALASMEPAAALIEAGRLMGSTPRPKMAHETDAPAPLKRVGGGRARSERPLEKMTFKEYEAHRLKQMNGG